MASQEILKAFNEECRAGKHPLVTIYSDGGEMESTEVRWCPVCGSVAVDTDFDDRINPGAVMPMLRPKILKEIEGQDKPGETGKVKALMENDGLGFGLVLEVGEKKSVPVTGGEAQLQFKASDEATIKSVDLLQQAGILALSPSGGSFSLTPDGIELHSKLLRWRETIG